LPDDLPHHNKIVTAAFVVVAFSLFAHGLTMTPLLLKLGQLNHHEVQTDDRHS
jgi:NhaP-type Na+/H+ or K+/H+ antiporter